MSDEYFLFPGGLPRKQFAALQEYAVQAESFSAEKLESLMVRHLADTNIAASKTRLVNVRLANAIAAVVKTLLDRWDDIPRKFRYWLAGAILYFADTNDDEDDFRSAIGFEDDAEVLNACLIHAGLATHCINVGDYDDA